MVNRKRIMTLIKFFEKVPRKQIDQDTWCTIDRDYETVGQASKNSCGTAGCIAWHTIAKWGPKSWVLRSTWMNTTLNDSSGNSLSFLVQAKKLLGLSNEQAIWLFAGNNTSKSDRFVILKRLRTLYDNPDYWELPYSD